MSEFMPCPEFEDVQILVRKLQHFRSDKKSAVEYMMAMNDNDKAAIALLIGWVITEDENPGIEFGDELANDVTRHIWRNFNDPKTKDDYYEMIATAYYKAWPDGMPFRCDA